jgi:hypothetical protein
MCISSLKSFFIYLRNDLSSNFYLIIRKIFEKIQSIMKILSIFRPKFFLINFLKSVNKNEKNSHLNFFHACLHILWLLFEKSWNVYLSFCCRLFRNFMKIFRKSSPKIFIVGFLKFPEKIKPNHILAKSHTSMKLYSIYLISVFQSMERSSEYCFWTTDKMYNTCLLHRFVPLGTQFIKILFFSKNLYKIAGVIGYFTFKSQNIFL